MNRWRTWRTGAVLTLIAVAMPTLAHPQEQKVEPMESPLRVVRDVVTTGVVNREPIDGANVFPPSVGSLYYFTEIETETTPTQITHIWYFQDQKMAEVPLSIEAAHWRTWSQKRMLEAWTGPWKVEAVDATGKVLSSQTFDVH